MKCKTCNSELYDDGSCRFMCVRTQGMTRYTRDRLEGAIDELKREGYITLIFMLEKEHDDTKKLNSMEVLCSETNNPLIVAEMARTALESMVESAEVVRQKLN